MTKHIDSNDSLRSKILNGVNKLADPVASTLGPKGRTVMIQTKNGPTIATKDGVTVAKFFELEDPIENAAAQAIKQVSEQTNSTAGDGTTTSTVLSREILKNSQRALAHGCSPTDLKRGMDKAVQEIVKNLSEMSTPVMSEEAVQAIATISANNDKAIGQIVAEAVIQVGKDGSISIEESGTTQTTLELKEGFQIDSGYVSNQFVTDKRRAVARHMDPLVLVTDESIYETVRLIGALEIAHREKRPLIIIAEDIQDAALAGLINGHLNGAVKVVAIKAPSYAQDRRNILRDLAVSLGATFITKEDGLNLANVSLKDFGTCKIFESHRSWSAFVGGSANKQELLDHVALLRAEIEDTADIHDAEKLQERLTRLSSGAAIIRAGGKTQVEAVELKHRVEDAIEAVRAAQSEGVIPGGGVALIRASQVCDCELENEDQKMGFDIIIKSVEAPIRQMSQNAGLSPDIIVDKVKAADNNIGFNFVTEELVDFIEAGVIDPLKVTRTALENAVSVASTLITTNYAIIEK